MINSETESVCRYLQSMEIQMSPNNSWLNNCMDWYRSHPELAQIYGPVQDYVWIQWLLADLRVVQQGCLPTTCNNGTSELIGKYSVQINWVRDIGQSCYAQLRAAQNINEAESNESVSVDEPRKQSWEPKANRMLMMEVSDGITNLQATEYSPIPKLTEPFLPGCKVVLVGPIECRNGILFLKNENITILGGEVDNLYEINSKEKLLSRCLNIPISNATEEGNRNGNINRTVPGSNQTNRHQHSLIREEEDSTSMIENSGIKENINMLMTDEDDDILCQLPDEVLDCYDSNGTPGNNGPPDDMLDYTNDGYPDPQELSLGFNERSFRDNRLTGNTVSNCTNKPDIQSSSVMKTNFSNVRKPKLFPSVDDLRLVESKTTTQRPPSPLQTKNPFKIKLNQTSAKTSCSSLPPMSLSNSSVSYQASTSKSCDISLNESLNNLSNVSSSHSSYSAENKTSAVENIKEHNVNLQPEKTNAEERMVVNTNINKLKTIKVKVESITKLKIRNSEWFCSASVIIENKSSHITFSDKVLEKLFGVSSSEVEVWRDEMATNPSLKKRVNDILKAGQTKLKLLDCPMVLEYSSDDCIPQVVSISSPGI